MRSEEVWGKDMDPKEMSDQELEDELFHISQNLRIARKMGYNTGNELMKDAMKCVYDLHNEIMRRKYYINARANQTR